MALPCLGAIDGKRVHIRAPGHNSMQFFNYKKTFSINLMAISDKESKFIAVDIGQVGSASDTVVWDRHTFGQAWNSGM